MNWFMSLFRKMFKKGLLQQKQASNRKVLVRGTLMSFLALGAGAAAYGIARRNSGGGNLFQKIMQSFRLLR
jgi:hypothetical protein